MKAVSFFALSLAVLSVGCRERDAEKSSPTDDGVVAATKASPQTPSKPPGAPKKATFKEPKTGPSGGKPNPYLIRASCAAFSPDGKTVLVGFGHDMIAGSGPANEGPRPAGWSLQLFDVEAGKHLRTLNGHQGEVFFVAFFPDGKTAISAGGDDKFRVWDVNKGVELRALPGGAAGRDTTALLPDGKHLLCYSLRGLQLWDVIGEKLLKVYDDQKKKLVTQITISSDGNLALIGSPGYLNLELRDVLELWDVRKGKILRSFDPEKERLGTPNAFSEDSKIVVSARRSKDPKKASAVLWEVSSGKEIKELAVAMNPLSFHLSSMENRMVVAGRAGWPGELVCLDLKSGKELWSAKAADHFEFFVFSANGKLGFSAFGSRPALDNETFRLDIILWDTKNGKKLRALRPVFEAYERPFSK